MGGLFVLLGSYNPLLCVIPSSDKTPVNCFHRCTCYLSAMTSPQGGCRTRSNMRWALTFQITFFVLYTAYFVYLYVDCHTLEAEELSFGLGSEPIGCTVGISSRRRPRYHIPPAWRCLLEKRHGEAGGPHIFVTSPRALFLS